MNPWPIPCITEGDIVAFTGQWGVNRGKAMRGRVVAIADEGSEFDGYVKVRIQGNSYTQWIHSDRLRAG